MVNYKFKYFLDSPKNQNEVIKYVGMNIEGMRPAFDIKPQQIYVALSTHPGQR